MIIDSPEHPEDHPDRLVDCEISLRPAFELMVEEAKDAGWTEGEVTSAMIGLAADLAAALVADRGTEQEVAMAQMLIAALGGKKRDS